MEEKKKKLDINNWIVSYQKVDKAANEKLMRTIKFLFLFKKLMQPLDN